MIDELNVDWASLTNADMYTIIKQTEEQNAKLRELVRESIYARDDADWASIVSTAIELGVEMYG